MRRDWSHNHRGRSSAALTLVAAFVAFWACPRSPESALPPGLWLTGDAGDLDRLAGEIGTLEGTPAGDFAGWIRARLEKLEPARPGEVVFLHRPADSESAPDLFELRPLESLDPALADLRGDAAFAFALPAVEGGRLVGTADLAEDGSLSLEARLERAAGDGSWGLLFPGDEAAGEGRLRSEEAILHARVRADRGLDLAALIPDEGDVDRMFRLKSRLFSSFVLDGTWELAVYPPPAGRQMLQVVLALGVQDRRRALEAVEEFLADVEARWPVRRRPFRLTGSAQEGECLANAAVMPELAPCWVALDTAVVFAWNAEGLERALLGGNGGVREPSAPGRATVFLDRLPAADRALAATLARSAGAGESAAPAPDPLRWPWRRLDLEGRRDGDLYRFHLDLQASSGSAP